MIDLTDLRFQYGDDGFALHVSGLSVQRGETAAVIGPSGSGKTTLLNLIAGVVPPQGGRVVTNGVDVGELDDRARRDFRIRHIGLVFQEFELLDYLTVLDNILLPYRISAALRLDREVRERAVRIAEQVGIQDKLGRHPDQLSQGERQRVAVCRAVLPEPVLLLADEPTGNLDPGNKDRVLDILLEYTERSGATFVTVTHDRDVVQRFHRVIDFKDLGSWDDSSPPHRLKAPGPQ
jgi:ABC-type lipoprotein export system ATPase subunit